MPTTITAYSFEELSPEAQERALNRLPYDNCEWSLGECMDSLKAFGKAHGFALKDWSIGDLQRSFTQWGLDEAVSKLSGPRSIAWIENNIFSPIRASWRPATIPPSAEWGRIHGKYSRRYCKPGEVKACPYTGVSFDEDILDAFRDKDLRLTIGERFASIGDRLSRVIESERDHVNSAEGRREQAEAYFDGALFDEHGKRIN